MSKKVTYLIWLGVLTMSMQQLYAQELYFLKATQNKGYGYYYPLDDQRVRIIEYTPAQDSTLRVRADWTDVFYRDYKELESVVHYPKFNVFCFQTTLSYSTFALNTACINALIELSVQCPENYSIDPFLPMRIVDNHWAYCCSSDDPDVSDKDYDIFRGMDFAQDNHFEMLASDFGRMHLTGAVTIGTVRKPHDENMYLAIVADIENRPSFSVVLPQKYWVDENYNPKKYTVIWVNDDEKTLIKIRSARASKNEDFGHTHAALCDKQKNLWKDVKLKGGNPILMTYGRWLAGVVQDGDVYDKESPGAAERDVMYPDDSYDRQQQFYRPGILFLYNTENNNYIEWETHQGDSEILLVQDEVVYYRIFDAIYKVPIINGEKLGEAELLVKDSNVVPFIHWAFFGKESENPQTTNK